MMGFGHVPTGSIRNDGHTRARGPRRMSSTRRVRGRESGGALEASDLPIAHRIEDEGEQLRAMATRALYLPACSALRK